MQSQDKAEKPDVEEQAPDAAQDAAAAPEAEAVDVDEAEAAAETPVEDGLEAETGCGTSPPIAWDTAPGC